MIREHAKIASYDFHRVESMWQGCLRDFNRRQRLGIQIEAARLKRELDADPDVGRSIPICASIYWLDHKDSARDGFYFTERL